MKEFLLRYWVEMVFLAVSLIEVIFFFAKKKPSMNFSDRLNAVIDEVLPGFIILAESTGLSGTEKLSFVLSSCLKRLHKSYAVVDDNYWTKVIIQKVEAILSCPQKKEGLTNEKI